MSLFANVDLLSAALTDTGNAERLVALHGADIRYCYARRRWLAWDGARWAWRDDGIGALTKATLRTAAAQAAIAPEEARPLITRFLKESESAGKREAMAKLAQCEPGVAVDLRELDGDPWLFNCATGTIDLRTGDLRAPARRDMNTRLSPACYEAGAVSPVWDAFLRDVTGGDADLEAFLKRLAGYCLTGAMSEKAFFFLYGPPDGAKSTFVNALVSAWGDYATTPAFSTWLVQTNTGGNRGDVVALAGARLAVSVEARKGVRFDEEILKRVTGGDLVTAAAKYEAEVTFAPSCKIMLAANDAPRAREDDAGFWTRCRRIPFEAKITRVDKAMGAKLRAPEVQRAILAWAVEGCLDWQAEGLGTCAAVERSTAEYRQESDIYAGFFESCKSVEGARCKTSTARKLFELWCKDNGIRAPLNNKEFRARLGALFEIRLYDGHQCFKGLELDGDPSRYVANRTN
jgi:putative DNA primase/helicase